MLFPLPACIQVLNGGVIQREATYPQEQSPGSEIILREEQAVKQRGVNLFSKQLTSFATERGEV